jgi:ATP synthase protein I
MPKADEPNDKALRKASTLGSPLSRREKRRKQPIRAEHEKSSQDGYRLLADLIGGVLVGLGFGWLLDRYAGTGPGAWSAVC